MSLASSLKQENLRTCFVPICKHESCWHNHIIWRWCWLAVCFYNFQGVLNDNDMQGIIPRIIGDIFSYIYQMDENLEFHIKVKLLFLYRASRITLVLTWFWYDIVWSGLFYIKNLNVEIGLCFDDIAFNHGQNTANWSLY